MSGRRPHPWLAVGACCGLSWLALWTLIREDSPFFQAHPAGGMIDEFHDPGAAAQLYLEKRRLEDGQPADVYARYRQALQQMEHMPPAWNRPRHRADADLPDRSHRRQRTPVTRFLETSRRSSAPLSAPPGDRC